MALDSAFLDEVRARVPIASVIGRRTKLTRSGRNWKACCPFHGEKTPSFYVYDDHFHCFGCGAHGDVISFVMQSEGRSFPEAVEQLAGEAGLEMPRQDPRTEARAREAKSLGEVLEAVQAIYRRKLYQPEGREGLAYLRKRGLSDETIEAFGLGWSGDGRGGLLEELRGQNVTPGQLMQAGLMRVDERGEVRGELFFSRVMFPIRDRRGRLISFGGRILGDGQPKYVNGPETALFSKRRNLFNLDLARQALRDPKHSLLVVEGYMDVIALYQAGFRAAVAPLGTALGAEQLEALWREAEQPIICLDGDAAGSRAALRAAETALPLVSPERSLRFCRLDAQDDPDSLIRREGSEGMRRALANAVPLADELFGLMSAGMPDPSPEQRAALRARLEAAAALIGDRNLAGEYRRTLLDRFFSAFRKGGKGKPPSARGPIVPRGALEDGAAERLKILTAILLAHPDVLPDVEQAYSLLELPPDLDELRGGLLDWLAEQPPTAPMTQSGCLDWLAQHGLEEAAQAALEGKLPRVARREAGEDLLAVNVRQQWWHFYGLVNFPAFEAEVMQDMRRALLDPSLDRFPEGLNARMQALEKVRRGESVEDDD
ncbi:DNA primase [Kozakia baliensis]|uniref:DNA primase n=1 Tax=Kozakia baliensis TaxID=153496 RepID=UPI000496FDF8|nr:DNA primase [Kozakia baliensis]AOX19176.1 DNA primase [Kozakia baliensis]